MSGDACSAKRVFHVLVVDDSPADALVMKDCLQSSGCSIHAHAVHSGDDCLAFLRKEGAYQQAPTPNLIITDFNLPAMSGPELLKAIGADPGLSHLPVVVMSGSDNAGDIRLAYRLRCSSFVIKPVDFDAFERKVKGICAYWFSVVTLPPA